MEHCCRECLLPASTSDTGFFNYCQECGYPFCQTHLGLCESACGSRICFRCLKLNTCDACQNHAVCGKCSSENSCYFCNRGLCVHCSSECRACGTHVFCQIHGSMCHICHASCCMDSLTRDHFGNYVCNTCVAQSNAAAAAAPLQLISPPARPDTYTSGRWGESAMNVSAGATPTAPLWSPAAAAGAAAWGSGGGWGSSNTAMLE